MKKHIVSLLALTIIIFQTVALCSQPTTLQKIETERMKISDQIRFMFSDAIDTDYIVDTNNNQCSISLFNLPLESLNQQDVTRKIKSGCRNISTVTFAKTHREESSVDGTVIRLTFIDSETHLNFQVLDAQFIIDIISPSALRSSNKITNVISQAHNGHGPAYAYYSVRQLV